MTTFDIRASSRHFHALCAQLSRDCRALRPSFDQSTLLSGFHVSLIVPSFTPYCSGFFPCHYSYTLRDSQWDNFFLVNIFLVEPNKILSVKNHDDPLEWSCCCMFGKDCLQGAEQFHTNHETFRWLTQVSRGARQIAVVHATFVNEQEFVTGPFNKHESHDSHAKIWDKCCNNFLKSKFWLFSWNILPPPHPLLHERHVDHATLSVGTLSYFASRLLGLILLGLFLLGPRHFC